MDDDNPTKHDLKDALVIAKLIKDGRYSVLHPPAGIYAELRNGMNLRFENVFSQDLIRIQVRIQNWLDHFFPKLTQIFKDWEGKAAILTLREFPLPQDIIMLGEDKILETWKEVKRAVGTKRVQ